MNSTIKHWLKVLFISQLVLFVIIPGGSIFGINFKILLFFLFFILLLLFLSVEKVKIIHLPLHLSLLVFVVFYLWIAYLPHTSSANALIEARLLFITFFFPFISILIFQKGIVSPNYILKTILFSHSFFISGKLILFILVFIGVLTESGINELIKSLFGVKVMTLSILPGITRIQFNTDILTVVLLFILLCQRRFGFSIKFKYQILLHTLFFLNIAMSFSRFFAVGYVLVLFVYLVVSITNFRVVVIAITILFSSSYFISDQVVEIIQSRFSSRLSGHSDSERYIQAEFLIKEFRDNPIFGNGFGGYCKELIRDYDLLFSYELQLLSFLMKFGALGSMYIFFVIVGIAIPLFFIVDFKIRTLALFTYFIWISANFFNPYMTSSLASVVFVLFITLNFCLKKKYYFAFKND